MPAALGQIHWAGLASLLALGATAYALLLTVATARRLAKPPRRTYAWAVSRGVPGDPREACGVEFAAREETGPRGERIAVWDVPGERAAGSVVIVTHGWGSSRIEMLSRLPTLRAHASRVVLWDMPGHGESPGWCRLNGTEPAVLRRLIEAAGSPVVLYGWSLGAEACVLAAAGRADVRGVIAEGLYRTGWVPAHNMLRAAGVPAAVNLAPALAILGWLGGGSPLRRWRDVARDLASVSCPVLLLHGASDEISPLEDIRRFADGQRVQLAVIDSAGHADVWAKADAAEAVSAWWERLTTIGG